MKFLILRKLKNALSEIKRQIHMRLTQQERISLSILLLILVLALIGHALF